MNFGYRIYDPIEKKLVRSRDIIFMENQTIEDIDKAKKVESSSFDGIVHHDDVSHTSVHDDFGLDNHGHAQNHVSNQHVDVDNNNDIVIDDPVVHEVVDKSNISLWRSTNNDFLPPFIQPMSMCYSLKGENLNVMRRPWKMSTRINGLKSCKMR